MLLSPVTRAEALGLARAPWTVAALLGALVVGAGGFAASGAKAQAVKSSAPPQTAAAKPAAASKPLWRELTARQQKALEPLAPYWDELTEPHKRKWLAMSRDYGRMSPEDQEVLHSRMTDWASLSNQQRAQARVNFANVKQVPVDERKAKWEAYQALSDEEKSKLAERAKSAKLPGAAPTIRPVPEQKLVPFPPVGQDGQHTPRIQLAPPAPVASARPAPTPPSVQAAPPAPAPGPAPSLPPVSAEAQYPPPSSASDVPPKAPEQPAAAP